MSSKVSYFRELDGQAVMKLVRGIIDKKPWPKFLKDYSIQKVNLVTTGQKTVGDILSNVTKTWTHKQGCVCNEVKERLRKAGDKGELPEADGHIFFIGRDYKGPGQRAMNVCTKNVPISTKWDLKIKWEQLHKQLPNDFCGKHKWAKSLYECTRESFKTRQRLCPDSREVYTFKRLVDGLRIGPLDKNNGELWCFCPTLYNKALEKAFSQETGYVEIHPKKLTSYKKKTFPLEKDLTNNIRYVASRKTTTRIRERYHGPLEMAIQTTRMEQFRGSTTKVWIEHPVHFVQSKERHGRNNQER